MHSGEIAVRRTALATADMDEAAAGISQAFTGLRVRAERTAEPFAFDYSEVRTTRFAIHRLRCAGAVAATGPLPEAVAVGRRCAGDVAISRAGSAVDTSVPYLRPIEPSEFAVRDGRVALVTLQPASVSAYIERSGERGAVASRLDTLPDLAAWQLVMDHALTFLDAPEAFDRPGVEEELHDLLCWSLLRAFDDPWAETARAGARSTALRRALRHLDEHADETVTMPGVAEAARVSLRTLNLLFRRELDTTPLRWLRDLRLDRTRIDLLAGAGSVAEIAARHRLGHGGRFAADYHARFGEHPHATLRGTA